jgi:hypothetical protein
MYNSNIPARAELPSSAHLVKSTVVALFAAAGILVTVVLPAEYGIDVTGVGRVLGLTEMGEAKQQAALEAAGGHAPAMALAPVRSDETVFTLQPSEGVEYKLALPKASQVQYSWSVDGGVVNYNMHGTPAIRGREKTYKANRDVANDAGLLTAGFDGVHGWYFRNRGAQPVTITLQTSGPYPEVRRIM